MINYEKKYVENKQLIPGWKIKRIKTQKSNTMKLSKKVCSICFSCCHPKCNFPMQKKPSYLPKYS